MIKAGLQIGSYEVVSPLGSGGMGEVWRAHDVRIDRDVAIKFLPDDLASNEERLARFDQEARAAGALNHPNVLTVFELGTHEGHPYLVSELLEGATLREKLGDTRRSGSTGPSLPLRTSLDYGTQIASGLAAAHEKGIVHRDLKPENVFVTADGRVKILDFGLAKLTGAAVEEEGKTAATAAQPTSPGAVLGTVGYMAPEQVRGGAVDARTDIFAFGVVLYEMLSGRRAFEGESPADTMSAILREDPPEPSTEQARPPAAIDRIVRRCLEKEPAQRFQSARDLAFALEAVAGSSSSSQTAAPAPTRHRRSRRALAFGAFGLLAALAATFWAGGALEQRRGPDEVTLTPLTFRPLTIWEAAYAPDQRAVIFSASETGTAPSLYSVSAEYPEPRPMGLPDVHLLAISSKGEMAVLTEPRFLGHRLFEGTLARVPTGGTAPRRVLERVRQAAWSPDGNELAVVREIDGIDRLEFPVGRVLHHSSGYISDPRVSPSGDRIAFFEHPARFDDRGSLAVVDLKGHASTLADGYWGEQGLAWTPDGETVIYSASSGGSTYALYEVDLRGRSRLVRRETDGLVIHDVAPSGAWLVSKYQIGFEVWGRLQGMESERNLSWLDFSAIPFVSADGRMLLFEEESQFAGLQYALCLREKPDAPVVRLGDGNAKGISADGTYALALLYGPPQRIVAYPIGPGRERRLEPGGLDYYDNAAWFPDGERLLVCGGKAGGASRCFVQSFDDGVPKPITPEGTGRGIVSPDGRQVAVRDTAGRTLVVAVEGGDATEVTGIEADEEVFQWTADGRGLLVFRKSRIPGTVDRVDIASGSRRQVLTIEPADRNGLVAFHGVSLAADGRHYAYSCWRMTTRLFTVEGLR
jgi:Tol biopolymer transport system component